MPDPFVAPSQHVLKVGEHKLTYRGYAIEYDPPPIPVRGLDWVWCIADGYDGAVDSNDPRCGRAASIEDCLSAIDELIEELGL